MTECSLSLLLVVLLLVTFNGSSSCHNGKKCSTHDLWHELNGIVENYLDKITIDSLVENDNSPYIRVKEIN